MRLARLDDDIRVCVCVSFGDFSNWSAWCYAIKILVILLWYSSTPSSQKIHHAVPRRPTLRGMMYLPLPLLDIWHCCWMIYYNPNIKNFQVSGLVVTVGCCWCLLFPNVLIIILFPLGTTLSHLMHSCQRVTNPLLGQPSRNWTHVVMQIPKFFDTYSWINKANNNTQRRMLDNDQGTNPDRLLYPFCLIRCCCYFVVLYQKKSRLVRIMCSVQFLSLPVPLWYQLSRSKGKVHSLADIMRLYKDCVIYFSYLPLLCIHLLLCLFFFLPFFSVGCDSV